MLSFLWSLVLQGFAPRSDLPTTHATSNVTCPSSLTSALQSANFSDPSILSLSSDPFFFASYSNYNLRIPITPCAVVSAASVSDVSAALAAVSSSNASGVHVQARSGGHSYGNYGLGGEDGAVVIYLENLTGFEMDNSTWLATVGAGTKLGDLDPKLAANGNRTTPHGICPQVGIGGHATIGGLGPLSRLHGTLLDQVVEAEVVIANGTVLRANNGTNSDIFWAIRGGGGSFGVVTEFVIKTYPLADVVNYAFTFDISSHADMVPLFSSWQSFGSNVTLDRRLATMLITTTDLMIIMGTFYGTMDEFDATGFEAALGQVPSNYTKEIRAGIGMVEEWFEQFALTIGGGVSSEFYSKSLAVKVGQALTTDAITNWFSYLDSATKGTEIWFAQVELEQGATNDVPVDATAYAHRDTLWLLQTFAIAPLIVTGYSDTITSFLDNMSSTITDSMPDSQFGLYPGYVDPMVPKNESDTLYWGSNYDRLVQVKQVWDPNNVFANPQSVGAGW